MAGDLLLIPSPMEPSARSMFAPRHVASYILPDRLLQSIDDVQPRIVLRNALGQLLLLVDRTQP
jgi:hypothetical protein